MFENGTRREFKLKREEETGGWSKFRVEEPHSLFPSQNIIFNSRRVRLTVRVAHIGKKRNLYRS
jgi:hypothetical protein